MMRNRSVRILTILIVAGLLGAATTLDSAAQASQAASGRYSQVRSTLLRDLEQARREGFTKDDLADISSRLAVVDATPAPPLGGDAGSFYLANANTVTQLDLELSGRKTQVLKSTSDQARSSLDEATAAIAHDRGLGAVDADLAPLEKRLASAKSLVASASSIAVWRKAQADLASVSADATALGTR